MILLQVNSIYDLFGLVGFFIVWVKIMMRQLWVCEVKINQDDFFLEEYKRDWVKFFLDFFGMNSIKFERCLKFLNVVGDFSFVIFSDGLESVYGVCVYVRWVLVGGGFGCSFVMLKNCFVFIKKMFIDRIELCGVVLNKCFK